jgi:hypothetical protein
LDNVVRRGATFLDKAIGTDWDEAVNLDALIGSNGSTCLLGQLYGSCEHGLLLLMPGDAQEEAAVRRTTTACEHGFMIADATPQDYAALDNAWRAEIAGRRAARARAEIDRDLACAT